MATFIKIAAMLIIISILIIVTIVTIPMTIRNIG
jgi:hypothetical protein